MRRKNSPLTTDAEAPILSTMNAIILSIGDELVLGQTVDTNSAWLSQQLAALGIAVAAHLTIPDDQKATESAIRESATQCDVLLISGGIGPTEDDLTRQALAEVLNAPLEENPIWIAELHKFFEARGRVMPPINRIQAMIPRGADIILNTCGTAAGIRAILPRPKSANDEGNPLTPSIPDSCAIFAMPGVPKEMKAMFCRDVLPYVKQAGGGAVILSRTLHTFGLGESAIAERLGDLMRRGAIHPWELPYPEVSFPFDLMRGFRRLPKRSGKWTPRNPWRAKRWAISFSERMTRPCRKCFPSFSTRMMTRKSWSRR